MVYYINIDILQFQNETSDIFPFQNKTTFRFAVIINIGYNYGFRFIYSVDGAGSGL